MPLIAIPVLRHPDDKMDTNYVRTAYIDAVEDGGGSVVLIPTSSTQSDVEAIMSACDGLLLPGGFCPDPHLYGAEPQPSCGNFFRYIDDVHVAALRCAMRDCKPVLGICRGMQLTNVALGGTSCQQISERHDKPVRHYQKTGREFGTHTVTLRSESHIADILGTTEMLVNSMHRQCADVIADSLMLVGTSPDGVPEAIESADGNVILVQWHPEELRRTQTEQQRLFDWLIESAQ